jgi:hypothetical protein
LVVCSRTGHNLVHEDHDMMRAYVVVGGAGQDNMPALNPSTTLIVNEAAGMLHTRCCITLRLTGQITTACTTAA